MLLFSRKNMPTAAVGMAPKPLQIKENRSNDDPLSFSFAALRLCEKILSNTHADTIGNEDAAQGLESSHFKSPDVYCSPSSKNCRSVLLS
jgi:hypothetical protein